MALPLRPRHAQLPLAQLNISPFQRHHLAAAQAGVTAQQDRDMGHPVRVPRRRDQPLVRVEVSNGCCVRVRSVRGTPWPQPEATAGDNAPLCAAIRLNLTVPAYFRSST